MDYEETTEAAPFSPEIEASLRQNVLDQAPARLARLAAAIGETEVFTYLPKAAAAAFHLGRFSDAKHFADRALALAPQFAKDWNYGNAIHRGHTVLGLLALGAQDLSSAISELHLSGLTPGSPQLKTYGPTMHLAKELLKVGQVDPVLAYLDQCRVFWVMRDTWLEVWERKVREGRVPNFFQHAYV